MKVLCFGSLNIDYTYKVDHFVSKSSNSPFKGATLYGKIHYTICGGEIVYSAK